MTYCEHEHVCGRAALPGQDKCILHSENAEKDKQKFETALEEHVSKKGPVFRKMVVPIAVEYNDEKFEGLDLSEAVFLGSIKFLGCTFENRVVSMRAVFKEGCAFNGSELRGGARFRKARFEDYLDFTGATIHEKSVFTYSAIGGEAKFTSSTLHEASFELRTFEGEADFAGVDFTGSRAEFGDTDFQDDARFNGATFKADALFGGRFSEGASFRGATFKGWSNFSGAEFVRGGDFSSSTFKKQARFKGTCFEQEANFTNAKFEDDCVFRDAKLRQASFEEIEVAENLLFSRTFTPNGHDTCEHVTFDGAHVEGSLTIEGEGEEDRPFERATVSFQSVSQSPDSSIRFRYADLRRCRFLNTDLRSIDFLGVKWCGEGALDSTIRREWFNRVGLFDEVTEKDEEEGPTDQRPWPEIERLYRQLKLNYEGRGDFPRAGDFHIGEKEARRRNPETRWGPWLLLTAYRALSKYGERALPAALWLTGIILTSMTGYVFLGAIPGGESTPLSPQSPDDWLRGLTISMEATFFPVQSAGFRDVWARILNVVQRILSPPIIALLVLALRQRVKR